MTSGSPFAPVTIDVVPVTRLEITAKVLGPGPGVTYTTLVPSGDRLGAITDSRAPKPFASATRLASWANAGATTNKPAQASNATRNFIYFPLFRQAHSAGQKPKCKRLHPRQFRHLGG